MSAPLENLIRLSPDQAQRLAGGNRSFLVGLIGKDIQGSKSPLLHEREAADLGLTMVYQLLDLRVLNRDVASLEELLKSAELMGFSGLNITHPAKQAVIPHLTDLSDEARIVGAVNTVKFSGGRRVGYNTDASGFAESFRAGLPGALLDRVVQLGAGGAGAATAYAMLSLGTRHLTLVDAQPERARQLAAHLGQHFEPSRLSVSDNPFAALADAQGLVHATPTGMREHPGLPVPREALHPSLWVAEIVYFPLETELLKVARELGCRTLDGGGMAVFQAAAAFEIFTDGQKPDRARMLQNFRQIPHD